MRKVFLTIVFSIVAFCCLAESRNDSDKRRLSFGAEWSYIGAFHCGIHHNFFSEEGYRVDINTKSLGFKSNGEALFHVGYDFDRKWNLSMYAGFAGIYGFSKVIPVSLRLTRFFNTNEMGDRLLCFFDGGSGISIKRSPQEILVGKIGGGYRIALSCKSSLDFIFAYRVSFTHPTIFYDGYEVGMNMTNRNNAYVSALSAGISLSF